ncbi:MAG: TlpA family protein disulfide reductase [Myxococcales bacterium]|nr:TlpA family protein disulfide reductase [Myxococcales bacterium]
MKKTLATLTLLSVVAGCGADPATQARIGELEQRLSAAEEKLAKGGAGPAVNPAARPPAEPIDQEAEKAAAQILKDANTAFEEMRFDETREKLAELNEKFPTTRAARAAKRIEDELEVIGKDAGSLEVDMWYQGETSMADGDATLLVFWEVWCPHCKREVPKVEATYTKYKGAGLNIVGLTKQTRDVTEDQVKEFIASNNITYPIAKEAGQAMSTRFGVKGIPAAAVVKDGKVVWRGHPARITDQMIEGWVN